MLVSNPTFAAAAAALLSALPAVSASLYLKSSPVVQVDAKSYDRLVAKSNYTTVRTRSSAPVPRRAWRIYA